MAHFKTLKMETMDYSLHQQASYLMDTMEVLLITHLAGHNGTLLKEAKP